MDFELDDQEVLGGVAKELISSFPKDLWDAGTVKIAYFWSKKPRKSKGRQVLATTRLISPQDRILSGYDYTITVDLDHWQKYPEHRRPLMMHELMHVMVEEVEGEEGAELKLSIRPHDLEEFGSVLRIFGAWEPDVKYIQTSLNLFASTQEEKQDEGIQPLPSTFEPLENVIRDRFNRKGKRQPAG